jgi:methylglutaconyl-CoA hydratase
MKTHDDGYVHSTLRHHVVTIEFFHPKSNALPGHILDSLAQHIHAAGNEDECKVIVLRSAGEGAFCAGASFDELVAIETQEEGLKFFSGFAHVINALRKCPQLVIGRIHGKCVGGGVGLAAACDYALALDRAEIKLSELAVGFGPFVIGPAVERKMGMSAFSQLAIDASNFRTAEWACRKGLYASVYKTIEELDESIAHLAATLASRSPLAMNHLKQVFWEGAQHWDSLLAKRAAVSGKLVLSDFSKQAIAKFKSTQKSVQ